MRLSFSLVLTCLIGIACNTDTPDPDTHPQFAAHYQNGLDALQRNNLLQAEKAFQQCIHLNPNAHHAYTYLARTYIRQQKFKAAQNTLQTLLTTLEHTHDTKDIQAQTYLTLAQVFSYQHQFADATTALKRVLDLNPNDTEARLRLGYFLGAPQQMLVPDLAASKRQFEKVLQHHPNHLDATLHLGLAEFRLGYPHKAAANFQNIIQNYPRHAGAYYYLGVYYLRNHEPEKAVQPFKQGLRLNPRDPETLYNLWTAYSSLGGYPTDLEPPFKIHIPHKTVPPQTQFTNIAPTLSIDKLDGGRGSAWGDYNNDGHIDILAVGTYQPHALYRNNGDGTFTNTAETAGIADSRGGWGSLFADYDNDGDLDIYITRGGWAGPAENTLYRNNGDGTFTDTTHTAGVADPHSSFCAAWADYNTDGFLDLYIANGVIGDGAPNTLYKNNGDGTFTNTAHTAGVAHTGNSLGTAWGDYNNDGHIDLHLVNFGQPNVLYKNNGDSTFTDVTAAAGMKLPITDPFVTFFLDIDNDKDLDIFISNSGTFYNFIAGQIAGTATHNSDRQMLYQNNGDGTFTDITKKAGLYHAYGAMGANFGDINNDGFLDIYLATGAPQMGRLEPDALFVNNGDGTFTNQAHTLGIHNIGKAHGVTFGDADADGDLDIYVPVGGAFIGDQWDNHYYQNNGTPHNSITVKLIGIKSNRNAIGAKVTLTLDSHTHIYRELTSGGGFGSTNALDLHIGLGRHTHVQTLHIQWPSGHTDTYTHLKVNTTYTLTEGGSR